MNSNYRVVSTGFLTIILAILCLEGIRGILGGDLFDKGMAARWLFVSITLVLALFLQSKKSVLILAILAIITSVIYIVTSSTIAAWILMCLIFVILLWIAQRISVGRSIMARFIIYVSIALFAGVITLALEQVQTRFSEEEFFVALQTLFMAFTWGILALAKNLWKRLANIQNGSVTKTRLTSYLIGFLILIIIGSFVVIKAYQDSFYPKAAPGFKDISLSSPFICGEIDQVPTTEYLGESVYEQILELVEANPNKKSPEFGMIALGHKTSEWKNQFRESLLEEARQGLYTQPNNSVKFSQYEAALRAYYYSRINDEYPDLFSPTEVDEIQAWFSDINQRAQTVEWVDWMYAIAYNKKPEGPYENQEIGAGLLALLESKGLADPGLSELNRSYLNSSSRGWEARFRNTDDAAVYQPEWINNALFQTYYTGETNYDNLLKSIQWLLLQSLPDGSPLKYNHVGGTKIADISYLGAGLLENRTVLWFAGKSADYLKSKGGYLSAIPGVEAPVIYSGIPPDWGSCLLFGDSGVPNQVGPLAPDKLTFRDGWTDAARYMLINLRFSGWHRYKATNTITMLYQGGLLVGEKTDSQPLGWLPVGRSLFRDKRIPRENLNGLVIKKMGLSAAIQNLTGIGSSWAQDPPYYAEIKSFKTSHDVDSSHTVIEDWHGWSHNRKVFFFHDGPIVVVDEANGNKGQPAAITWHAYGQFQSGSDRIALSGGSEPSEMLLIPNDGNNATINVVTSGDESNFLEIQYQTQDNGELSLITIFLDDKWSGANTQLIDDSGLPVLVISKEEKQITLPLDS